VLGYEVAEVDLSKDKLGDMTAFLYGLILGDGSYTNGFVDISHTNKQRFYIEWLEKIFSEYKVPYKTKYDYNKKTTFGIYKYSSMLVKVSDRQFIEDTFLSKDNKKIISKMILDNISLFGILLWYLDDGHLQIRTQKCGKRTTRFAHLNTQSFTLEENELIQDMFKKRFNIDTRLHIDRSGIEKHKHKKYYRIYINQDNFRKFYDLMIPFFNIIPKEFYYKFDMKYVPNRFKKNAEYALKYNLNMVK
jgi:hypothetical protein